MSGSEYTPVLFSALPLVSSVSPTDETLVVQAGVAKRARFNALPTAPAGPPGPQGPPGTQILTGSAPPTTALGSNGDIYIQINNGDFYRKISGTWNLIGNIKGPQGQPGNPGEQGQPGRTPEFLFGIGIPNSSIGANGDIFIDTDNGNLYYKNNNNWTFQLSIKGIPGSQIYSGNNPPATTLGNVGDYYINTTNGNLFQKEAGDWVLIYNLGGTGGGNTVFVSFNFPSDADGNNGDITIYNGIDSSSSGYLYRKNNGQWVRQDAKVITSYNILRFQGLSTSPSQPWEFDSINHEIFDLFPDRDTFHIRFSPNNQFYYEVIGYNHTLEIEINKQPNKEFFVYFRTAVATATVTSQGQENVSHLVITIQLGFGEKMIFFTPYLYSFTDNHYIIQTFRQDPGNWSGMYQFFYL